MTEYMVIKDFFTTIYSLTNMLSTILQEHDSTAAPWVSPQRRHIF
jgi:hypothetical protein